MPRYNGYCSECNSHATNLALDNTVLPVPKWNMNSEGCYNCDLFTPPADDSYERTYTNRRCDDYPDKQGCDGTDFDSCSKRLWMKGRSGDGVGSSLTLDECLLLANADEECGNTYFHDDNECYCWRKDECCGSCLPSYADQTYSIYEIDKGEPNPTCEGGVLNQEPLEEGTLCCSEACVDADGNNQCGVDFRYDGTHPYCSGMEGIDAMCCKPDVLKSCSESSFPCWVN